jgi:hypothetical protein
VGGDRGQRGDLVAAEPVEHQPPHRLHVGRGGPLDRGAARVGQHHERAPGIGRALLPPDQAPPLHPGDLVRDPALLPGQRVGDLEHPPPARRRLAEHDQHIVIRQRQSVVILQLPVHLRVQLRGHLQQPAPGPLLILGQPSAHDIRIPGN